MPQATSSDHGTSLFNVHMLRKKNQSLKTEIENHEPRITLVCNNGQKLIDENHEDSPEFEKLIADLKRKYQELKEAVDSREKDLKQNEKVQQVKNGGLDFFGNSNKMSFKKFLLYYSISSTRMKLNHG